MCVYMFISLTELFFHTPYRKCKFFFPLSNLFQSSDNTSRRDVATFVNSCPTLDVSHELVKGEYTAGSPIILKVTLARDVDNGDDDDQTVVAPIYPHKKLANWWLVVGDPTSRQLLGNYSSSDVSPSPKVLGSKEHIRSSFMLFVIRMSGLIMILVLMR